MLRHDAVRTMSVRTDVIELLDAFRAAERAGAEALGRWTASCRDPALRGGLRVIHARDDRHAALAEQRLRALGGAPEARPDAALVSLCEVLSDPAVSDRSKLAMLVARMPPPGRGPLAATLARLEGDPETHALLAAIDDEERSSVGWLRHISARLASLVR